jgi:hypothetical protein
MEYSIKRRLLMLGYVATDEDAALIAYIAGKVTNHVKNECNIDEIPPGLREIAVDMCCGEFLQAKASTGGFGGSDVSDPGAVKAVTLGDTRVEFATAASGAEMTMGGLIGYLLRGYESDFSTYRRLAW